MLTAALANRNFMIGRHAHQRPGFGVVEVLLSLGMLAIIVVAVGNSLAANDRLSVTSFNRDQALNYARQALEIVQQIKNQEFSCSLTGTNTTCNNGSPQDCTPLTGYTSCWSQFPTKTGGGYWSNGPLQLVFVNPAWELQDGTETIGPFTRSLMINNSDASCPPAAAPNHCNMKTVAATVAWTENGATKNVTLSTEITGWQNQ